MNGPPRGSNTISEQASYDMIFKDVIIKSENRNTIIYPNPNNYSVELAETIEKIYKAEIISVNIPAATDIAVNLTSSSNRLYFSYDTSGNSTKYGYIKLQAGTYMSPSHIAAEIQRQFLNIVTGLIASYNSNLNRYIFVCSPGNILTLFPTNGTTNGGYTVRDSIAESLKLYTDPSFNISRAINIINNESGVLTVVDASGSDYYGSFDGTPTKIDSQFSNTIASNLVLTNCNIYLSLGKLNSNTIQFVSNQNNSNKANISSLFCEIPNNTTVSSNSVKTLLNQPNVWSSENFYNPPVPEIQKFDVSWYDENGQLININEHCFTIRMYYLQKRNQTTSFSVPMFTYTGSGTVDSMYEQRN
jgi:hypothetical protein